MELNWCLNPSPKRGDTSLFGKEFHFISCKDTDLYIQNIMSIQLDEKKFGVFAMQHKKAYLDL